MHFLLPPQKIYYSLTAIHKYDRLPTRVEKRLKLRHQCIPRLDRVGKKERGLRSKHISIMLSVSVGNLHSSVAICLYTNAADAVKRYCVYLR